MFRKLIRYRFLRTLVAAGVLFFFFLEFHLTLKFKNRSRADKSGREVNTIGSLNINSTKYSATSEILVLVLVCNRMTLMRTLNQLFRYRPSQTTFPIVVSFDCDSEGDEIRKFVEEIYVHDNITLIKHPNYGLVSQKIKNMSVPEHMKGYYHLSAHYQWALSYAFTKLGFEYVIIVEDDLDIAPDFFEYFSATLPLLREDPTLWCISAWNDNGGIQLIDQTAPELLHRTDFFPGLGWMLSKTLWHELENKWPVSFWDDWMRDPEQRKGRACIRPEISRSKTYGRIGASNAQYFDKYLKPMKLNKVYVPFTKLNLSYLLKDEYDKMLRQQIRASTLVLNLEHLLDRTETNRAEEGRRISYKLLYRNKGDFQALAEKIGMMKDFKSGVPRGGYYGILSVMYQGIRVYLVPEEYYTDEDNNESI